jgi:hypothetical protein
MDTTQSRRPIGAILAIVGGALLAIGSFLAWAEVSGGGTSVTAKGTDGSDGWVTLVAGLIAIAAGVAALKGTRRALAILMIIAGLIGGGLGLYDALTAKDSALDTAAEEIAPQFGASVDEVRTLLDQAIDSGELSISISIGLYVVIAGGILVLVGGFLSLKGGAERADMKMEMASSTSTMPPTSAPAQGGTMMPPPSTPPPTAPPPPMDPAP